MNFDKIDRSISTFMHRWGVLALRISLGIIFIWFGILKPLGLSLRLKEIEGDGESADEAKVLKQWLKHSAKEAKLKKQVKDAEAELDDAAYAKYPELTEDEVKALVVDDKWLTRLDADVHGEMDRISQSLTQRVKELAERYETPLPRLSQRLADLEEKVNGHLERMGFAIGESVLVGSGR